MPSHSFLFPSSFIPKPLAALVVAAAIGSFSGDATAAIETLTVPTSVSSDSNGNGAPYGSSGNSTLRLFFDASAIPATATINSATIRITGSAVDPSYRSEINFDVNDPDGHRWALDFGDDLGLPDSGGPFDTGVLNATGISGTASGTYRVDFSEDYNDSGTDALIETVELVIDYDPNIPVGLGAYLDGVFPTSDPTGGGAQPPALLSQTGAFSDLATLTPIPGLIPYDVNSPLWSDGAQKKRWVAVPTDGTRDSAAEQVVFSPNNAWAFPTGTVAIKHFELQTDANDPAAVRRLETRFLVLTNGDFYGVTYRWRPDGTDADLLPDGDFDNITITAADNSTSTQRWDYPSRADCRACHNVDAGTMLGLATPQLNGNMLYPGDSTPSNQLEAWEDEDLFTTAVGDVAALPKAVDIGDTSVTLGDRVHSYLATNCSMCHYPGNFNNDFDLRFETTLDDAGIIDDVPLYALGIPDGRVIAPQDPGRSLMYFRMETEGIHKMPPIGRNVTHVEAVDVLRDWINTLSTGGNSSNPPIANDDDGLTLLSTPINIAAFSNDFDADGDSFTLSETTTPPNGSVSWSAAGVVTYTPDPGFAGIDEFSYIIIDSGGSLSNVGTITVTVSPLSGSSSVSFTDSSSLLADPSNASGVAIAVTDMNQDGLDDIVHFDLATDLFVDYQQPGGATFTQLSLGTASTSSSWGMAIGDADNNGKPDIIAGGAYNGLQYYRANSAGTAFTKTDLNNPSIFLQAINFADIDMDGWLDIFACHDDAESAKFRNSGNGVMIPDTPMMDTATVPASDNSGNYGSVWTDYDGDGDVDLYVSKCRLGASSTSDPRRINQLFQNDGSGQYTEVAAAAGLAFGEQSWVADFADIDNDGDLDCFVGNHSASSVVMRNDGDGTFTDITASTEISVNWDVIQSVFRDFNSDGWIDLLLVGADYNLWLNDGDGTFTETLNPFGSRVIESCAVGDLNRDGFPDVYAGYASLFNSADPSRPDKLFLSNPNGNSFLSISLLGRASNRLASGAWLELHGPWGIQLREVRTGEGYGISHSLSQRFGMGSLTTADKLVVRWPSGTIDTAFNVSANQFLTLEEGDTAPPELTNPGDQTTAGGTIVQLQLTASDPHANALTYSATNLPTGLTIEPTTGLISGTTADASGVFQVTVSTSDGWSEISATFNWTVTVPDEYVPDADTVALYHFTSDFSDSSGNAFHLTESGSVALAGDNLGWMNTPGGNVARFDAVGDKLVVNIPDSFLITAGDSRPLTIEARIYPRAWLGFGVDDLPILSLEQDDDTSLGLEDSKWGTGPKGPRAVGSGIPLATATQYAASAPLDQWSRLEISFDGSGTVTAWIDGQPTSAVSIPMNVDRTNDWILEIGNFDGDIDEVYIHRGAPLGGGQPPVVIAASTAVVAEALKIATTSPLATDLLVDTDTDGFSNLVETAFVSDPDSTSDLPQISVGTSPGGLMEITYRVPDFAKATAQGYETAAFEYTIEISEDLLDWQPTNAVAVSSTPAPTGSTKDVTQRVPTLPNDSRQFVRIVVESR